MEIIDVTIRESVYLKRGMTEEKAIKYLKKYCELMPFNEVRDVEICFLDNEKHGPLCYNEEYIRACNDVVKGKFGLIAVIHPNQVNLKKWNPDVIKLFRMVCFIINESLDQHTIDIVKYLHDIGVDVSFNVIYITRKDNAFVDSILKMADENRVECFSFADSCGGITPDKTMYWVKHIREINQKIALNFHFHDHSNLALANAFVCIDYVSNIDASVYGLGKGGGNLNLEDCVFLNRKAKGLSITQDEVVRYANLLQFLMNDILEEDWQSALVEYKNLLIAVFDCNLKEIANMEELAKGDYFKFYKLISATKQ